MTKYNNGKIYKIEPICDYDEGDIYIGSTTNTRLCERMTKHRHDYKKQGEKKTTAFKIFDKYGIENCRILLLENFSCETRDELQAREGYYIRSLKCVNRIMNGRTDKQYREDNKEKKKSTDKLYYEKNKEMWTKKNICSCGCNITQSNKNRHEKTEKHKKLIELLNNQNSVEVSP